MQAFRTGFRNIMKNWRHSAGAILSVAIGFSALALFSGYIDVVEQLYEDNYRNRSMFGDVIIEKSKQGEPVDFEESRITEAEQAFLEKFYAESGMVDARVNILIIHGLANNSKASSVFWGFGYERDHGLKMRLPSWEWNVHAGQPLDRLTPDHVLLGSDIAETFGCKPIKPELVLTQLGGYEKREKPFKCDRNRLQLSATTFAGQANAANVTVGAMGGVGLRGIDSLYLMMDLGRAQDLFDTKDISHVRLRLKNPKMFEKFIRDFRRAAERNGHELIAADWRDHVLARVYKRTISLFQMFRNFVSAVILTISGMSVLNAMVKNINERQREIGTLRSIGFVRREIRMMFTVEGLIVGLAGSAIGTVFSLLFSVVINKAKIIYYAGFLTDPVQFMIGIHLPLYLLSGAILCAISAVTAYITAGRTLEKTIPQLLTST